MGNGKRRLACAAILAIAAAMGRTPLPAQEPLEPRIERLARPYLENDIVLGMTVGVLHEGRAEFFGYGALSRQDRRAPDGETIFEIGSITKVFTGLLLADAVVQGRVALDQTAGELLPAGVAMPGGPEQRIQLVHLATHTSGLPRLPENFQIADAANPYAAYSVDDLYAFLNGHTLARAPGEKSEYSNLAQGLLGHLLSLEAGSTYEELLRRRIALPLDMPSTRITLDEAQTARLAPGSQVNLQPAANWDLATLAGAGAIRSTARDMLRFAAAMIDPPEGKLGEAIELAWKVHQPPLAEEDFAMGLGWHVARDGATRWHTGQTGGYHAMLLVHRPTKASVVLLANTATMEVDRLAEDVLRMVLGAEVEPRQFEAVVAVPLEMMQKYAGRYELAPGAVFTVSVDDGKLMVGLTGQPTLEVFARAEREWFYKVVDASLTFHVNEAGKCTSLTLRQNGVAHEAKRITE
jgi:CubicO group peptidase (beta-lactamase class C family)